MESSMKVEFCLKGSTDFATYENVTFFAVTDKHLRFKTKGELDRIVREYWFSLDELLWFNTEER
jgi:hypothetical protein